MQEALGADFAVLHLFPAAAGVVNIQPEPAKGSFSNTTEDRFRSMAGENGLNTLWVPQGYLV